MQEIYNRVAIWNSLRYKQEFNLDLAIALLKEEAEEFETEFEIERIDALCDLCYVALGCLWKLNVSLCEQTLKSFISFYQLEPFSIASVTNNTAGALRSFRGPLVQAVNIHSLLAACYVGLCMSLDSEKFALMALLAVCDSNDSKEVQAVSSHIKANGTYKGENYFSPTAKLMQIIQESKNVKLN